jgi:archaellum biogenesis ATPase FlaH
MLSTNPQIPNSTDGLVQSDRSSSETIIWVDDREGLEQLEAQCKLLTPNDKPEPGQHIIALSSERNIKRVIRAVGLDNVVGVIPAHVAFYGLVQIFEYCFKSRVETWIETINSMPLELEDALKMAGDILADKKSPTQANIELETLRKRCGMDSFGWRKFIADLEAEIHAAVDGKSGVSAEERLKLDISAWLRTTDPFKQEIERGRIESTYRIKDKVFERLCKTLRESESRSASKPRLLKLGEGLNLENHALQWLVPGYIPSKVSGLLSGLPGSGKSLLSVDLAHGIAKGGKFMGEQCRKGRVLLINSDQPLNITMNYLSERGFDESETELMVAGESGDIPAWNILSLELLETWLEEFKPDLVIADSIRTIICYPLGLEEKSEQVGHWMKEVERLVTRYGSLLWIHHDNKDKDQKGVGRSSGSTAIPGNVSFHWRIEATSNEASDLNRKISMPKTRGYEASTVFTKFNLETGEWELKGIAGESGELAAQQQSLAEQILHLLSQCPGVGLEGSEIRSLLGGLDSVYTVLSRLVARGIISKRKSKVSKGKVYFLPDVTVEPNNTSQTMKELKEPSPPSLLSANVSLMSESINVKGLQTPNTTPNTTLNTNLKPEMLNKVLDAYNVELEPVTITPNTLVEEGGEGVSDLVETVTQVEKEWQLEEQVTVEADIRSLKDLNGKQGIVTEVQIALCGVEFSDGEFRYVPFWALKRLSIE